MRTRRRVNYNPERNTYTEVRTETRWREFQLLITTQLQQHETKRNMK